MEESSAYGQAFGGRLKAQAVSFVRTLRNTNIAVTEVRADDPPHGLSGEQIREDAFLIAVMRRDYPVHEYFEDGRIAGVTALRKSHPPVYTLSVYIRCMLLP